MDFTKTIRNFTDKCHTVKAFIRTKKGRRLFFITLLIFVLLFFAPMFHGFVGAALIGCVCAPLSLLIWRRYDRRHAIVPAVFFCIPMILDMLIYHSLNVASCLLVALLSSLLVATFPAFSYIRRIKDNLYAYLYAGAVCVAITILASLLALLVSIAWWLFCLFLFVALLILFFSVVLSTAAYTATDAKRQARKKELRQYDLEESSYDIDIFAQDIGFKTDIDRSVRRRVNEDFKHRRKTRKEEIYYDVED